MNDDSAGDRRGSQYTITARDEGKVLANHSKALQCTKEPTRWIALTFVHDEVRVSSSQHL